MKYKVVVFAVHAVVLMVGAILMSGSGGQQQNAVQKPRGAVFDKSRFPVANFDAAEPSDPNERAKRRSRG